MRYLAIALMIMCSSVVSLAGSRFGRTQPAAVPLWTLIEAWQKLAKGMTVDEVKQILGLPAHEKKVAVGLIWFYDEGDQESACLRFRGSNSAYSLYSWRLPKDSILQAAEAKQLAEEEAKEAERQAAEKAKQAAIEKTRLEAELKQAQAEKVLLAQKLQAQQRANEQQENIPEKTTTVLVKQVEPDNPFDEKITADYSAKFFLCVGGGLFGLAFLWAAFFRKTWQ